MYLVPLRGVLYEYNQHQLTSSRLAECSEDNQKMYFIMRGLLERTESLKVAIEDALVTHKPRTYRNMSARSGVEFGTSPRSSSDGQPLDDGAAE